MFHLRSDNVDDIKTLTGLATITGESIAKYLQDLDKKISEGKLGTPPANSQKPEPPNQCCAYPKVKTISGTNKYGFWEAQACDNCHKINFKKLDGSYKGWEISKKQ